MNNLYLLNQHYCRFVFFGYVNDLATDSQRLYECVSEAITKSAVSVLALVMSVVGRQNRRNSCLRECAILFDFAHSATQICIAFRISRDPVYSRYCVTFLLAYCFAVTAMHQHQQMENKFTRTQSNFLLRSKITLTYIHSYLSIYITKYQIRCLSSYIYLLIFYSNNSTILRHLHRR